MGMGLPFLGPVVPLLEMFKRPVGVYKNIPVLLIGRGLGDGHFLQPAMGAGNRIRLNRMGDVLMDATMSSARQ